MTMTRQAARPDLRERKMSRLPWLLRVWPPITSFVAITFCIYLLLGGLLSSAMVEAQPADRIPRIGFLGSKMSVPQNHAAFLQGLRDLGYVEGRNVVIVYREPAGKA